MSAKIIKYSVDPSGDNRIITLHARYWRGIHSELMTHRVFSRNARSSRAVPVITMLNEVRTDPFVPRHWGANQKGMQAGEECNESITVAMPHPTDYLNVTREEAWLRARDEAVRWAEGYMKAGYHKQIANRLLEPFMYIDTLITATEWDNFFELRDDKAAEPHIRDLAQEMREAIMAAEPEILWPGQWHTPYVDFVPGTDDFFMCNEWGDDHASGDDMPRVSDNFAQDLAIRLSVARCARISYRPFDGNADMGSELKRYHDLVVARPIHASPAEHQATPDKLARDSMWKTWDNAHQHRNFRGWRQYRAMIGA